MGLLSMFLRSLGASARSSQLIGSVADTLQLEGELAEVFATLRSLPPLGSSYEGPDLFESEGASFSTSIVCLAEAEAIEAAQQIGAVVASKEVH